MNVLLFGLALARVDVAPLLKFEVDGVNKFFVIDPATSAYYVKGCEPTRPKAKCEATLALGRVDPKWKDQISTIGGVQPGVEVCPLLGGRVRTGRDSSGDELSLCVFKDGSMLSTGVLGTRL